MPTIAHAVAALAKKLNPEAADCLSGNIKTNFDAITASLPNGEVSNLGTISAAIEMFGDASTTIPDIDDSSPDTNPGVLNQ